MKKSIATNSIWSVGALVVVLMTVSTDAFAGVKSGAWTRRLPSRHESVVVKGHKYYYNEGRFYKPWFFGFNIVIPPIGATVTFLPVGHRAIVVGGINYYSYDNVYYKRCPRGYIVVQEPAVVHPQQKYYGETVIINVPNSNGSFTPVALVKQNGGYMGPQGEYYPVHPTVEQLKALYGK
ncbi:MAG: hypothetical protein KJ880_07865 [Candidatus Omnitrophica bacterium]|nr:hypothetical protein [Candidatus Omnitrophota bacterium]MBU1869102.1 hypothetical protein [Candidatus Omnitrophota bacterium]